MSADDRRSLTGLYDMAFRLLGTTQPSSEAERLAIQLVDGLRQLARIERSDDPMTGHPVNPFPGQVLGTADLEPLEYPATVCELGTPLKTSNVVTSLEVGAADEFGVTYHRPVLDIDFPVRVVPSSTPGHCHLFLDRAMSSDEYFELIGALGEANILQSGYVEASMQRGFTAVRLPWVKKPPAAEILAGAKKTLALVEAKAEPVHDIDAGGNCRCGCGFNSDVARADEAAGREPGAPGFGEIPPLDPRAVFTAEEIAEGIPGWVPFEAES